ncbi:hypothetical protein H257_02666 [Aphanomyces astaci]|uniref:Uncharacterized protein n=1 Tax=Aphanomyces astaci TaxID=112090 RepID=W4H519_APHAT|nr:hypothetical protein H257_02666 [Aphanomyces astaci]ETV86238.1 hypothetical protein H257_02666 [Aphanomyces astaci]|eukprot:XP_009824710.1 hypothetical protein H257_02666 [Aphanomyces astaci]
MQVVRFDVLACHGMARVHSHLLFNHDSVCVNEGGVLVVVARLTKYMGTPIFREQLVPFSSNQSVEFIVQTLKLLAIDHAVPANLTFDELSLIKSTPFGALCRRFLDSKYLCGKRGGVAGGGAHEGADRFRAQVIQVHV